MTAYPPSYLIRTMKRKNIDISDSYDSDIGGDVGGPLFPGSNHTQMSSCISMMLYVTKHSLSKEAFADLLPPIFSHIPKPNKCVNSVYKIRQFLKDRMSFKEPIKRYICESCGVYMSRSEICENDPTEQCKVL